jgi:starch synthase
MPSKTEACGLAQMIAMRYGTIPVVRETGGLRDTVFDVDNAEREGNGFSFTSMDSSDLLSAVKRAIYHYQNRTLWSRIVGRAMEMDFSWEASAAEYLGLYRYLLR